MRLKTFLLNESDIRITRNISEIKDVLYEECYDIIKIYRRTRKPLYRGTYSTLKDYLTLKESHVNRTPSDTPEPIHDAFNKEFRKKFGWYVRNGVFVTGDLGDASNYGIDVGVFFPIGKSKFCWSPKVGDLFTTVIEIGQIEDEYDEENIIKIVKKYTDKDLPKAIKSRKEISFQCNDGYYLLSSREYDIRDII